MFTGKPPFQHGAHTVEIDEAISNVNPLHSDELTLAEVLLSEGYTTAAFVSNVAFLGTHWRLDQGFETYTLKDGYANRLNKKVFPWLETAEPPFFLFVNYIDTHAPYNTQPRPRVLKIPVNRNKRQPLRKLLDQVMPGDQPVEKALASTVIDQYDTGVANVDIQVGLLLDQLEQLGLAENTVVVITSDHGEFFGEHRLVEHGKDVYQEVINVPLVIRHAGQDEPQVIEDLAVSNDLPHLILSQFPEPLRARAIAHFPDAPGNHLVLAENYYTRVKDLFHPEWGSRFQRVRRAVFEWPFKYIDSSDGNHELYQLTDDPTEASNLIKRKPQIAQRLAHALQDFESSRGRPLTPPDLRPLTEKQLKALRALGYLD
jgi:arylsulfatase A-like enzyme